MAPAGSVAGRRSPAALSVWAIAAVAHWRGAVATARDKCPRGQVGADCGQDDPSALLQLARKPGHAPAGAGLHCCDYQSDQDSVKVPNVLLACEASRHDRIVKIPFAAIGEAPKPGDPLYFCGSQDVPGAGSCGARIESALDACIGKRTCKVDPDSLPNPCGGNTTLQLRVQWVCHCDEAHCRHHAAPLPAVPLSAKGNIIVDRNGERVRLLAVNWAGAHIVFAPAGLNRAPVRSIAKLIRNLGFNAVRLTWAVEGVIHNPLVDDQWVAANPSLRGKTFLEVFDAVVHALDQEGVLIILDNHMLDADWCCSRTDCNGLWFNEHWSEEHWVMAWGLLARRYKDVPAFVGTGLHNEPRSTCGGPCYAGNNGTLGFCNATLLDPTVPAMGCGEIQWGCGPRHLDWRQATKHAGEVVLKEKPTLLVSISGLEYSTDLRLFPHNLADLPKERVIYEAHDYYWGVYSRYAGKYLANLIPGYEQVLLTEDTGKALCSQLGHNCSGITCAIGSVNCTLRSGKVLLKSKGTEVTFVQEIAPGDPYEVYKAKLDKFWGFMVEEDVAPVWVSEWGFMWRFDESEDWALQARLWLDYFSKYIQDGPLKDKGGLDWGYWQLSGVQEGGTSRVPGSDESFGVLNRCWTAPAYGPHFKRIRELMEPPSEFVDPLPEASTATS